MAKAPSRWKSILLATMPVLGTASCGGSAGDYLLYAGCALLAVASLGGAFYAGWRWGMERGEEEGFADGYSCGEARAFPGAGTLRLFKECSSRQSALGVFVATIESGIYSEEEGFIIGALEHAKRTWKNTTLNADMFIALALRLQDLSTEARIQPKQMKHLIETARGLDLDVDHVVTAFRQLLDQKDERGAVNVLGLASPELCILLARELFLCRDIPSNIVSAAALATVDDVGSFATAIRILRSQRNYTSVERLLEYAGKTMSRSMVEDLLSALCDQAKPSESSKREDLFAVLGLKPTLMLERRVLENAYAKALGMAAGIASERSREERVELIGRAYEVLSDADSCAQHFAEVGADAVVAMRGSD
jgi:hypothetical protein